MSTLSLKNVEFHADTKRLLGPIDAEFDPNKSVAIMGPNGAGKSLFLELVHGLIQPSKGTISWDNKPAEATRNQRGYIFQKPILLRRSVRDNIRFAQKACGKEDDAALEAILKKTGLYDRAHQPAAFLSGGEAQRMALARALINGPKTLLMDEPTSSLDPEARAMFEAILQDEKDKGTQLIWISHNPSQAKKLADDVAFISDAQLCEVTPTRSFFKTPQSKEAKEFLKAL